jgi:hypothetical protein
MLWGNRPDAYFLLAAKPSYVCGFLAAAAAPAVAATAAVAAAATAAAAVNFKRLEIQFIDSLATKVIPVFFG